MEYMVRSSLIRPPGDVSYLDWIAMSLKEKNLSCHGLFTLNHDSVLETLLQKENIAFTDGFAEKKDAWSGLHWDAKALFDGALVKVCKLHGGADWLQAPRIFTELYEIPPKDRRLAFRLTEGEIADNKEGCEGLLLIGRHNKLYDYSNFLFEDLHYRFYHSLKSSTVLVCCGYGFGDKGINTRIINWLTSEPHHRILVIGPDDPAYNVRARVAVRMSVTNWMRCGQFHWLKATAEDMNLAKLKKAFNSFSQNPTQYEVL